MTSTNPDVSASRRVQLLGYFGWGNFGDDLFRETCQDRAGILWPGSAARVFESPEANFSDRAFLSPLRRLGSTLVGAVWSDTFAYCGGSVFSQMAGTSALRTRLFRDHRFEALGVSVGPFTSEDEERDVIAALHTFDRVVVRDQESVDRLDGTCVLGGDLASLSRRFELQPRRTGVHSNASADTSAGPKGHQDGTRLTICPSAAAGDTAAQIIAGLTTSLAGIEPGPQAGSTPGSQAAPGGGAVRPEAGIEITVLALNAHPRLGDGELVRQVASGLQNLGLRVGIVDYGRVGLTGVVEVLRDSDLVWSQRLHGAIAAYLLGVPVAVIDHHEKCGAFARDIGLDPRFLVTDFSGLAPTVEYLRQSRLPWTRPPADYRERAHRAYVPILPAQAANSVANDPK